MLVHGRVRVFVQRGELQFKPDFVRPEGMGHPRRAVRGAEAAARQRGAV